jgi:predicted nuclease of restriction endonuclease-like (RecB) superfamily
MAFEATKNYGEVLHSLKQKIRQARLRATIAVNNELLKIYWEIGSTILLHQKNEGWGTKVIDRLAADLKLEFSGMKGLSLRNIKYMRAFAEAYPGFVIVQPLAAQLQKDKTKNRLLQNPSLKTVQSTIVQPLVAQLPWTHHTIIIDKVKEVSERIFYIKKAVENGWSKSVLTAQIESQLYRRQGKAITNFDSTLTPLQSDLAKETLKNPYLFDFLSIGEEMQEREMEKALMQHIKKFLLELGRGFAYVGNQFNVVVEDDDFFLDLLFYNYYLHCFIVFELKIGKFKPEYAGKLNFYINTVDEQIKSQQHKPTIGVLLCKTPNHTVVKYALKGIKTPIGVADYEFAKALPKNLKAGLPSIEELEAALGTETKNFKPPHKKIKAAINKPAIKAVGKRKSK